MKNYTDLSVIKSSDVENLELYKEETVTESEFEAKKQYLYKGYEVPNDVQMLKFRYYTPENTLIEQNNVPYVYDGTSIKDIINYYYLSNSNTAPEFNYQTWQVDGWTKKAQTVTAKQRYLYCITETRFSNTPDGVCGNLTDIILSSVYGEQGERGAIYLGHYKDAQACSVDNSPSIFYGDYFFNTTDKIIYVYQGDSLWIKIDDYDDYHYSVAIDDIFASVAEMPDDFWNYKTLWVKNLVSSKAFIDNLSTSQITLRSKTEDDVNKEEAYIQSEGYVAPNNEGTGKGFKITSEGSAVFNDLTIGNQSVFMGDIDTPVMQALQFESNIFETSINKGDVIENMGDLSISDDMTATYDGIPFNYASIWAGSYTTSSIFSISTTTKYWATLIFYVKKNGLLEIQDIYSYEDSTPPTSEFEIKWDIKQSNKINKLKFINLPTAKPTESNIVYVDKDGFLKLS